MPLRVRVLYKEGKMKLDKKVVVITGASSGIGQAIAQRLHDKGAVVYNISRRMIENDFIKGSFQSDVNDIENIAQILQNIKDLEGKIDVFINNAGFGIAGAVEYAEPSSIYKQINTNLSSVIAISGLAIKYLKESQGRLINISSVGGIIPLPYQSVYSASKAGVEIFSKALANEVKENKIKVTAILPGDTKTGFTAARVIENNVENKEERDSIRLSISKMEKDEQKGKSPQTVAKVVEKVLRMKNPPLRKTVGFSYKLIVFLPRIFSTKFVNAVVRMLYCKKAKER